MPNGVAVRDGRSVSSTLHDRNRTTSNLVTAASTKSSSRHHHQHQHANSPSSSASQHSARDSFMSYFFGQTGPQGSHASHSAGGTSSGGRVFAEAGGNPVDGMHGLRTSLDGSNPAYDMKSLEKHIEAVGHASFCVAFSINSMTTRYLQRLARVLYLLARRWKQL